PPPLPLRLLPRPPRTSPDRAGKGRAGGDAGRRRPSGTGLPLLLVEIPFRRPATGGAHQGSRGGVPVVVVRKPPSTDGGVAPEGEERCRSVMANAMRKIVWVGLGLAVLAVVAVLVSAHFLTEYWWFSELGQ